MPARGGKRVELRRLLGVLDQPAGLRDHRGNGLGDDGPLGLQRRQARKPAASASAQVA